MVHRHPHRGHGANLQRRNPGDNDGADVHVIYVTAPATFEGDVGGYETNNPEPATEGSPVGVGDTVQATGTSSADETEETGEPEYEDEEPQTTQSQKTHTMEDEQPTKTENSATQTNAATTDHTGRTTLSTATTDTTKTGKTSATDSGLDQVAATTSASSSSDKFSTSPSTTPAVSSGSGDLSGGAKAGIAIGVILGVGLIALLVFWFIRKKKQNQRLQEEDEKVFGNHGPLPDSPPLPEQKTPAEPPQLNVRPITQFAPLDRKSVV